MSASEAQDNLSRVQAPARTALEVQESQILASECQTPGERSISDRSSSSGSDSFHPDSQTDSSTDDRIIEHLSELEDSEEDSSIESNNDVVHDCLDDVEQHDHDSQTDEITSDAGYISFIIVHTPVHELLVFRFNFHIITNGD